MILGARTRLRLALVAYAAAILAVATLPGGSLETVAPDKAIHAVAYAALTLLALFAGIPPGCGVMGAVGASLVHGAVVEAVQSFLPWRRAEWADLAADGLGALAAAFLWLAYARLRRTGVKRRKGAG